MITDTDRINALEKMGSIAIWHGSFRRYLDTKLGKPTCARHDTSDKEWVIGGLSARAENLRDAIDQYLANNPDQPTQSRK
tara:strand:+ start:363 stop:602 length:240 start_codon:yes stop_codon:yes gene_type:complete